MTSIEFTKGCHMKVNALNQERSKSIWKSMAFEDCEVDFDVTLENEEGEILFNEEKDQ